MFDDVWAHLNIIDEKNTLSFGEVVGAYAKDMVSKTEMQITGSRDFDLTTNHSKTATTMQGGRTQQPGSRRQGDLVQAGALWGKRSHQKYKSEGL